MGQEISTIEFSAEDYAVFQAHLRQETALLGKMLNSGNFDDQAHVTGFELEAWLLDHNHFPAPINTTFLERINNPLVVPELSRFNIELNGTPQGLQGFALSRLEAELSSTWRRCLHIAHELEATLIMIGTLPTLRNADLCLANISPFKRYVALNEQVIKARDGRPIRLDIHGRERLIVSHHDVMLEAATTSFQVHLQAPAKQFQRYFNASLLLSAPLVAIAANSPFLFEKSLWDETRIPVFEQVANTGDDAQSGAQRVSFGSGYISTSPEECFQENLASYPVLLPINFDSEANELQHLRFHNGTIWRWNRPLIGFDADGTAHLRVEHRVMPAGPSIADMIANAALYLGATCFLANMTVPPEADLSFETARDNFYLAARHGLDAQLQWLDGKQYNVRDLLLDELLPMAAEGLKMLGIAQEDSHRYLGILRSRARAGQNGAAWQRAYVDAHGRDFFRLTAAYLEHQYSGMPVHEWAI
ncbi:MAG: glutamate--cysteine ligase [Methylococcaceae bacterium]|nr:glutamate--cysteine ligase [Methylococcaceae bacterium]